MWNRGRNMKMVPSFYPENTPPGEVAVYNLLSQASQDWVAIHSLDIAPMVKNSFANFRREIDFVLIIPDAGVLCIEVKSHNYISFDGYQWSPKTIKRSPFEQAKTAGCTFFNSLKSIAQDLKRLPVLHCCIFPNANFELVNNIAVQSYELMDRRAFIKCKTGDELASELRQMLLSGIVASSAIQKLERKLGSRDVTRLIRLCQPLCNNKTTPREEIERRLEENEKILRQQQLPILELTMLNPRVIVNGGAGTGKTLVAIRLAKQLSDQGLRVGLFCFNTLVGKWISGHFLSLESNNVIAGSINSALSKHANIQIPPKPTTEFWDELPSLVADYCSGTSGDEIRTFDYIILDEAQDILAKDSWYECLDYCLEGGLINGNFVFFGDFANQVLINGSGLETNIQKLEELVRPASWFLSENCRNYPRVGGAAVKLSGLINNPYRSFAKSENDPLAYGIDPYSNQREQVELLTGYIDFFLSLGYKQSEITLLSFKGLSSSSISPGSLFGKYKINRVDDRNDGVQLESIYTYKGMENKVVILFDVELQDDDQKRNLLYTGITRATEIIRILISDGSKHTLMDWMNSK
ncbi:MAG: hypothetical protein ACI88H_001247 [Cocleimonas sp.]